MIFGCHLSIRNGYFRAAKQAYLMGAKAFQYFPKNPRSLHIKEYDERDAQQCKEFCKKHKILTVCHSPYPTNLTPTDSIKREEVIRSLQNDLEIAEACGSIGVVVHFGKLLNPNDPLRSYKLMIDTVNEVLSSWEGSALILLENYGGPPGSMGTTLEELVQVRNLCDHPEKIGFCFDTCHAYASGLWDGTNWQELWEKGNQLGYFQELRVIHLNNSKYGPRLGKDRHASIFVGGKIKVVEFDSIMKTPELKNIPFILETPKEDISHTKEIELLNKRWGET